MSKTLAEHVADEWWFKVREHGKRHADPFRFGHLENMIASDLQMGHGIVESFDIAQTACEILRERLAEHRRREARHGVQEPSS